MLQSIDGPCNGECGATEEHMMEYDNQDLATLSVDARDTFSSTGHYPLLAGHTKDRRPTYCSTIHAYPIVSGFLDIPIQDNIKPDDIKIRIHYSTGSIVINGFSSIHIKGLRYDPGSYSLCEHYSSQAKEANDMDATGPFSWKFHRKLPDIKPPRSMSPDEAMIRAPEFIWAELLIESATDGSSLDDNGLVDMDQMVAGSKEFQEKAVETKQESCDSLSRD